jgi:hypothetical protein
VIPWRGDEDFHISLTLTVVRETPDSWFILGVILIIIILSLAWKKSLWAIPVGILSLLVILYLLSTQSPYQHGIKLSLRYPFVNYWFYSFIPKFVSFFGSFHQEIWFRIPIALAVTILITVIISKLGPAFSPLFSVVWAAAFATIPILFYYSSILYLEMPAVLLMFIVVNDVEKLFQSSYESLKQRPGWYALLLVGFIKETIAPFLVCFLLARWVVLNFRRINQEKRIGTISSQHILRELLITFCVLTPVFLYLYLRTFLAPGTRTYRPSLLNLIDLQLYSIEAKAFIQQFGITLIVFLAAIILAFYHKKFLNAFFWILSFTGLLIFYMMDNKEYAGYSRFNLVLLPIVLAGSVYLLALVTKYKYKLSLVMACIMLVGNLFISPINLDGTKKARWGSYLIDIADQYYPYEDALTWIKQNYPNRRILLTGLYYPYQLSFYFEKLEWYPQLDVILTPPEPKRSVEELLQQALEKKYYVVLIPVIEHDDAVPSKFGKYQLNKVCQNQAHTLLIYSKVR